MPPEGGGKQVADNKRSFTDLEKRTLRLLAEGYEIRNAEGPTRANSILTDGTVTTLLARSTMAKLRNLGLIKYVRGAALARITSAGRRVAESFA